MFVQYCFVLIESPSMPFSGNQNIPRGSRKASRQLKPRDGSSGEINDYSDHWSRHEKYDGDLFLESNYRKHLSRHANK